MILTSVTTLFDSAEQAPATPTVIGIDTSLTATGVASSLGWCDLVGYTDKKNPITKLPHPARIAALTALATDVATLVGTPDLAVIETPAYTQSGGGAHERGWLWWDVYRRLTGRGVPIALMTPNQRMLYATGKGSGGKGGVIDAVARRWPAYETGGNNNLADAVTLMAAGVDALGHPLAAMPTANRAALNAIAWPRIGGAL